MSLTLRKYNISLDVAVKGLTKAEAGIKSLKGAFKSLSGGASSLSGTLVKLTAGWLSFQGAVRGSQFIFNTISSFESLQATLTTLNDAHKDLGRAQELAAEEMSRLRKIALDTPFTLNKVGSAFAQLKARGVDMTDTERIMESVGNTAAAFGQDITSFANAVGQAIAGENERLKQFGISAKVNGNKVAFTYQGVTKEVNRNVKEISETLFSFGDANAEGPFAGKFAMGAKLQARTIGGAFSRLQDVIQIFTFEMGKAGLTESLVDLFEHLGEVGRGSFDTAKKIGRTLGSAVNKFTKYIKETPPWVEKLKNTLLALKDGFAWMFQIHSASEALNRFAAVVTLLSASAGVTKLISFGKGLATALKFLGAGTLAGGLVVLLKIAAVLAILYLVVDDIITYMRDGDSLIGRLLTKIEYAEAGPLAAVRELTDTFKELWKEVLEPLATQAEIYFRAILPDALNVFKSVIDAVFSFMSFQFEVVVRSVTNLMNIFRILARIIDGDFKGALDLAYKTTVEWWEFLVENLFGAFEHLKDITIGLIDLDEASQRGGEQTAKFRETGSLPVTMQSAGLMKYSHLKGQYGSNASVTVQSTNNTTINAAQDPDAIVSAQAKAKESADARAHRQGKQTIQSLLPER